MDVQSSKWTAEDGGIGPGVDSYFEYLLKGAILFDSPRLLGMFEGKGDDAFWNIVGNNEKLSNEKLFIATLYPRT